MLLKETFCVEKVDQGISSVNRIKQGQIYHVRGAMGYRDMGGGGRVKDVRSDFL